MENAIEKIQEFHGHTGIWAALGYRTGLFAKSLLLPEKMKDLQANIKIPYKTPHSCFLDGIQISSCCTLGKCNIRFENSDRIEAFFENNKTDKKIKIELNDKILDEIKFKEEHKLCTHKSEIENTKWILSKTDEELFTIISS
ncbi:MAG: formylmethanofuran dehydrogenase subunit E family protein [Nanoarchaeota archaeon]|nr:formylmethanofuran dehydrogenase subunit E family protein [Nanoarchaeota archaeon]MBU2520090.1 formylmethanofuran dehydrogenase subunit E family protein [Nanoarchaeota archaeon]